MRVVDEDDDGAALGEGGQQAQRRGADREPLAGHAGRQRERARERGRLRLRKLVDEDQRGPQQLEQRRERDLRLGLDAAGAQHLHPTRALGHILEQRRLADAGLADERERRTRTVARLRERALDGLALAVAPHQHAASLAPTRGAPVARAGT